MGGRNEDTCRPLHPPPLDLATALRNLNTDIQAFEPSEVTPAFLSATATQKALVNPMHKFLDTIECYQADFIGDATQYNITIEDAQKLAAERGTMPMARQIALNSLIEDMQSLTTAHNQKITLAYEDMTAILRNTVIEGKFENILFAAVIKYLQIEKNIRKTKITKVFAHLADQAGQLL